MSGIPRTWQRDDFPPWLRVAEGEAGQSEVAGKIHNDRILEYLDTCRKENEGNLGNWGASRDETPWCSAFVNWCLIQSGIEGTNDARAVSWLDWGIEIDEPELGCVCVVRRKQRGHDARTGSSSGNHVAFWLKGIPHGVWLWGGNQGDTVKRSTFGLNYDVLGYRMPAPENHMVPYTV